MKYSFIIPMYNEENDIQETVKRCLAQDTKDFDYEIILINDGSTDNTLKICSDLYSTNKYVHLLNEPVNKGVSHARNVGVSESDGDIVIFLNADELIEPDFLISLHEHYGKKGTDYVFPQTRVANTNTIYGLYRDCYRLTKYHRPNLFMWSQGFSCRKQLFENANGFSESYPGCGGEDWDFVSRLDSLHKNRVVDTSIIVKHTVPYGKKNVLWHMYNRGRGTAYYDLIYTKKNPFHHFLRLIIYAVIFISFIIWDSNVALVIALVKFFHLINEGWKISKSSNNRKVWIILMHILNFVIRAIGYNATTLQYVRKE